MALGTEGIITIAFYAIVILLIIIYRKKFEFQGKIIALRRLKFGIPYMQNLADKHKETFKILGYIGIGIGFTGMIAMLFLLGDSFIKLFTQPDAPAAVAPLVPGVSIPGSPLDIPLWVIIPLFFVVLIHEAGHGLVAKAHKVPIINTGIVFFGPIAGAFVEPDEKKIAKANDVVKYSVFAAGPFFNALTALLVFALMMLLVNPITNSITEPTGFVAAQVTPDLPAAQAGMLPEHTYTMVDGEEVLTVEELLAKLEQLEPGDEVLFSDGESQQVTITTTEHPEDSSRAYIGVAGITTDFEVKQGVPKIIYWIMNALSQFFFWIFLLSIGLGAFNLLPLGPVDGGQMSRLALTRMFGDKKGINVWARVSMVLFVVIITLLIYPIFRALVA